MKFEYRKLSIALILLYSACMIFTAYVLFQLQSTLVYKSQVLSLTEMDIADPVFKELYMVVGATLSIGLVALLIAQHKKTAEVIYVEKKKSATADSDLESEQYGENQTLDLKAIEAIVAKNDGDLKLIREMLVYICKHTNAGIGVFYKTYQEKNKRMLELYASYALTLGESQTIKYEYGEGLVGQAALEGKTLIIDDVPEGYIKIASGLGKAAPAYLLIVPVKKGKDLYGVVEIASFTKLENKEAQFVTAAFDKLAERKGSTKKSTADKSEKAV